MKILKLLLGCTLIIGFMSSSLHSSKPAYEWDGITEFRYYGFKDPNSTEELDFVSADVEIIKSIFSTVKKSNAYIPKGASQYAQIFFSNGNQISIRIIAGSPNPFEVLNSKSDGASWFKVSEESGAQWNKYLHGLNEELKNK